MLITTTPGIEGRPVTEYLGIVTAQGVLGVNAFKDVSARVCPRAQVPVRPAAWRLDLDEGRDQQGPFSREAEIRRR